MSSYKKYVLDFFEYNSFGYIQKNKIEELNIALKSAYALYKKKKRYIVIKSYEGYCRVEQSEIYYFEIVKRKLFIHLSDNRVLNIWEPIKTSLTRLSMIIFQRYIVVVQ